MNLTPRFIWDFDTRLVAATVPRGGAATINYALDSRFRRKGLGVLLLKRGIAWLRATEPTLKIVGYVKQDNLASVQYFRQFNFTKTVAITQKNTFKYSYENL